MASLSSQISTSRGVGLPVASPNADGGSIDASARLPVLLFVSASAGWLLIGTVFALISSFKLHAPGFLGDVEMLTFGRVKGAESAVLTYGWGFNAAFALVLWLLARLSRAEIGKPILLLVAGLFWNFGVLLGMLGILAGHGTSLEWMEMPGYAGPLLFGAYLFIGTWALLTFRAGRSSQVYITQWYLLAALLWFPWIFSIAQIMLLIDPARGTIQSLVHGWYSHGLLTLWFGPIGIGAIYYFLPKLLSRPISNYYLSGYGFWTLAIFGGWVGATRLIGGPVPAWVVTSGIAASFMLAVPIVVLAVNFFPTMIGSPAALRRDWSFHFIAVGAVALVGASMVAMVLNLRGVASVFQFTFLQTAQSNLTTYGFFSMVAFGSLYYILPRVTGRSFPLPSLLGFHFWTSSIGCGLSVAGLALAGYEQGIAMNTLPGGPESAVVPFLDIVQRLLPYLFTQTLATVVLVAAHLAFVVNVGWLILSCADRTSAAPSALRTPLEAAAR